MLPFHSLIKNFRIINDITKVKGKEMSELSQFRWKEVTSLMCRRFDSRSEICLGIF